MSLARRLWHALRLLALAGVAACSGEAPPGGAAAAQASAGQVAPAAPAPKVSRYAAARFLEQASFGPTEQDIDRVRTLGFAAWIDEQLALPPSLLDGRDARHYDDFTNPKLRQTHFWDLVDRWHVAALTGPDQLRQRVSWSLSQFIVVSLVNNQPNGLFEYHNMLQRHGLGRYETLLKQVSLHAAMGEFLDNVGNRPPSFCAGCAANENYARELMQLFSIGLVQLRPDGSVVRDAHGRPVESYSQQDVADMARALTGWSFDQRSPNEKYAYYGYPLVAADPLAHDGGSKTVLGTVFPAGQSAAQDLDQAMRVLVDHANTPPFVSLRLIQHLVASQPTPAYVSRVAAVFRDNGHGQRGDLAAVVKAVLLDPEARRGDGGTDLRGSGKLREPLLFHTALLRGVGCRTVPRLAATGQPMVPGQHPYVAPSVFGFYAPTDTAPGSNLLAPEQRLLIGEEFVGRLGNLRNVHVNWTGSTTKAGCDFAPLRQAAAQSTAALVELISQRWFRGAMPAALRRSAESYWALVRYFPRDEAILALLLFALASPHYGAIT
ncbi:DUF1800 domain-containing protein [Aquabacterium humicola]|uniref:DUF1800 domain-containing protein n=1 Tax=Aquabacterium humicola TaxID=3237377 RepID=UPI0025434D76|nr:DUF1800 domain-containing protein [Rubrivivax pictus]